MILDLDNILFINIQAQPTPLIDVLGIVEDVMGNIEDPFYKVLIDKFILKLIKEN